MNKNEILARLQGGESMDTIADELAAMLNQAKYEYEEQLAAEAAAKEAEATKAAEMEAAQKVADAIYEYVRLIEPEMTEADRLSAADVAEVMAQMMPTLKAMKHLVVKPIKVKVKGADEAFNDFFKMFGL